MVDHEGLVKEIQWRGWWDGAKDAVLAPVLRIYSPEDPRAHELLGTVAQQDGQCYSLSSCLLLALLLAGMAVAVAALAAELASPRRRRLEHTPATGDGDVVIVDFPKLALPDGPACSPSSAITKVEAYLRFGGVPYSKRAAYFSRGGVRLSDGYSAIGHLAASGAVPAKLAARPTDRRDAAAALAVQRMADTDLAGAIAYYRWVCPANWAANRAAFGAGFGLWWPVRELMLRMFRRSMAQRVYEQGLGRHCEHDVRALVAAELAALSSLLGEGRGARRFLFGAEPCAADASVFGALDQFLHAGELNPQLREAAAAHPNLVKYVDMIRADYFGASYKAEVQWLGPGSAAAKKQD